jgi:type IV pilus assembly protein PilA
MCVLTVFEREKQMKNRKGFTLIELMIVILIVAVLAAILVPMLRARIDAAKWSEARSGIGNIASGLRAYWAEHQDGYADGTYTTLPAIADVCRLRSGGATVSDLDGKYFTEEAYALTGVSANADGIAFTITVTAASSTRTNKPTKPATVSFAQTVSGTSTWSQT